MDPARLPDDDASTDHTEDPEVSTPITFSANASPLLSEQTLPLDPATAPPKKKKKKKSKKAGKAKEAAPVTPTTPLNPRSQDGEQVLCISRNKHWRYISSYHGPWLQLPLELLESLFYLNSNPETYTSPPRSILAPPITPVTPGGRHRAAFSSLEDISPPDSPRALIPAIALPQNGKQLPPPIDPAVLRSVTNIRRLIDHATDLSVRASSGITSVELSSMRNNPAYNGTSLATAHSMGLNPLGTSSSQGRNTSMSANRVHRLRALAVQKLARAYMEDEIASSVMVMQGGSVFDDIAERVLKHDPNNADAKYVHFFHEKIPSSHRQLAESTSTTVLDELISLYPHQLEYYRTRGIVHGFREEFAQAVKDFTYALKEARAQRRAKSAHQNTQNEPRNSKSKKRKGAARHTTGQAPSDGTSVLEGNEGAEGENSVHPSVLPDAPQPIETQLLFFRGAAYLQHAVYLIESALIELEGVSKPTGLDGADLRLCNLETGRYGGVEIGNPEGPLGPRDGAKVKAYRNVLAVRSFRDQIVSLIKKSMRDHERFLSHFDGGGAAAEGFYEGDIAFQVDFAFQLSESVRPGSQHSSPPTPFPNMPSVLSTYHPLLVESHFSVLICYLLLADFANILPQFAKTAVMVDGVEGYPVFLPPRSMGQAEFIEVLERLASGWRNGTQPHSLTVNYRGKARSGPTASLRAIEAPPPPQLITPSISESPSSISTISAYSPALVAPVPSSSSTSISSAALLANTFAGMDMNGSPGLAPSSSSSRIPTPAADYITSPGSLYTETMIDETLPSPSLLSSSTHLRPDLKGDYLYAAGGNTSRSASISRKSSLYTLDSPRSPSRSPSLPQFGQSSSNKDKGKKANGADDNYDYYYNNVDDHSPSPVDPVPEIEYRPDSSHVLDCARILLEPVVKRQKERAAQAAADKAAGKKRPPPIHIPLHGPRVEIILAWLGAVEFPEIEGA